MTLPFYIPQIHEKRVKQKITLKIIFGKNQDAIKRSKELLKYSLTQGKFLDTRYVIPLSLWIYGDKVAFMIWESEIGILIENKETAKTFGRYFEILWKISKQNI